MSPLFIAGLIGLVLLLLIGYAFIYQTMESKRKLKQRLLTALKIRQRNFHQMLNGFPDGMLTPQLKVLIHKCLLDTSEQLAKLEPDNATHLQTMEESRSEITTLSNSKEPPKHVKLDNPAQAKEVRTLLQELLKFVVKLKHKKLVSAQQAAVCERQARGLIIQVTTDAYLSHAKTAQSEGKLRLASHHYDLAKQLLMKENAHQQYTQQIAELDEILNKLNIEMAEQTPVATTEEDGDATEDWDSYNKGDDSWKKKTVYD